MKLQERIDLIAKLGEYLSSEDELLQAVFHRIAYNNAWLTKENSLRAAKSLGEDCLTQSELQNWTKRYQVSDDPTKKKVGLVVAGNSPLEGLLDLIAIFISGHRALIKVSKNDEYAIPHIIKMLGKWSPASNPYFEIIPFLKGFDAIIANKAEDENRYFETYFGKYPNILRTKRNSVAVLTGKESDAQLLALGDDVFAYYGLTAHNVSKLYLPKEYKLEHLLEIFHEYKELVLNTRYKNNFDYNYSLYLLNSAPFKANGCVILTEDQAIQSRIACLHYEFYNEEIALLEDLKKHQEKIHFVVSEQKLASFDTLKIGHCHRPSLINYLDDIDTMQFLKNL